MRHMSFALTTDQMLARTKTVTRRLGWASLQPGTLIQAVEKSQGLGKGGKVRKLGVIRVVAVRREPLDEILIQPGEAAREGFPELGERGFLYRFCEHMQCRLDQEITRIEFEHVEEPTP